MSQPCPLSVHQKYLKGKKSWNGNGSYDLSFDYPRLIEISTKKTVFFWVPYVLREIKDLSNNRRKPSEQDRFVDEQTRMKWKYGWHVWSHLLLFYYFVNVYQSTWFVLQNSWLVSIWYKFFRKGISEQTFVFWYV